MFSTFFVTKTIGQEYNFNFTNSVYDEYIRSVQFTTNDLISNFPVISLKSNEVIYLRFDDLINEEREYRYRIIHCDKDWSQSKLRDYDFLNGFNDERLRDYEYSESTRVQFINYKLVIPNDDINFNVSGNYILVIYEETIDRPVLTRRFVVSEKVAQVRNTNYVNVGGQYQTNQNFQFEATINETLIGDPLVELNMMVIQNDNWNSAVLKHPNIFETSRSKARFSNLGIFDFKGLAEYREFDTRGLQFVRRGVQRIERNPKYYDVLLTHAASRRNKPYMVSFDFNGKFLIDNLDRLSSLSASGTQATGDVLINSFVNQNDVSKIRGDLSRSSGEKINAEYTNVIFTLENIDDLRPGEEVYILGGLNDWEPREEFRLKPSENGSYLTTEVLLKQGYYNFMFGILQEDGTIDYERLEGSWFDTENDYHCLVYYRGFGGLYDRVLGFSSFNTVNILQQLR